MMNESEKKVSIIIICMDDYGSICQTIDSALAQDIGLDNLEIIILSSFENQELYCILSKYEEEYSDSILLINCEINEPIGTLRNIALQYYSGKYVFFLPVGASINPHTMSSLYVMATMYCVDIIECNCNHEAYYDLAFEQYDNIGIINIGSVEQRRHMFVMDWEENGIYNRLYKSEFLRNNNITFHMKDRDAYFIQLCKAFVRRYAVVSEQFVTGIRTGADTSYYEAELTADEQKRFLIRLIAIRDQYDYIEQFYEEFEYLAIKNVLITPFLMCQTQNDELVMRKVQKCFDELIAMFPEFENNPYFLGNTEMYLHELNIAKYLGIQYGCDEGWTIVRLAN